MADLPMIKIAADTESGWMLINESDFNPEEDDLYEPENPDSKVAPTAPGQASYVPLPTVQPTDRPLTMTTGQLRGLAAAEKIKGRAKITGSAAN